MTKIIEFVSKLYEYVGLELESDPVVEQSDENIKINIVLKEEDSGVGIGHKGEGQMAVQRMIRIIFGREFPEKRIVLNVNQYQDKKNEKLAQLAEDVIQEVLSTGENQVIHTYLSSQERFVVHNTIANSKHADKVTSESEGYGRDRRVVVRLTETNE